MTANCTATASSASGDRSGRSSSASKWSSDGTPRCGIGSVPSRTAGTTNAANATSPARSGSGTRQRSADSSTGLLSGSARRMPKTRRMAASTARACALSRRKSSSAASASRSHCSTSRRRPVSTPLPISSAIRARSAVSAAVRRAWSRCCPLPVRSSGRGPRETPREGADEHEHGEREGKRDRGCRAGQQVAGSDRDQRRTSDDRRQKRTGEPAQRTARRPRDREREHGPRISRVGPDRDELHSRDQRQQRVRAPWPSTSEQHGPSLRGRGHHSGGDRGRAVEQARKAR